MLFLWMGNFTNFATMLPFELNFLTDLGASYVS